MRRLRSRSSRNDSSTWGTRTTRSRSSPVCSLSAGRRVFYLNRTSTDQVAGLMKGTRHSMGRNIMAKEIRAHFEELRMNLAK